VSQFEISPAFQVREAQGFPARRRNATARRRSATANLGWISQWGGRHGRSADRPERCRRDRSAHHLTGARIRAGWDERYNVAIWHDALLRRRSQKHRARSKGLMPEQTALHLLQAIGPVLTWCAGRNRGESVFSQFPSLRSLPRAGALCRVQ
jgi:hypothetical protein